jgi:hypothetical protein
VSNTTENCKIHQDLNERKRSPMTRYPSGPRDRQPNPGPAPQCPPGPGWAPMGATAPPPEPTKRNGFTITALALSLVGLVFALMPITGFLGFGAGLLAVLFALLAVGRWRRGQASKGLTIAALVLAILTTVAGFFSMKMFFDIVDGFGRSDSPPAAVGAPLAPADPAAGDSPAQHFTAGQTVDRDGLQITAEPLRKVKPQYGDRMVCSKVTYNNTGTDQAPFNVIDWKIQNPAGVQSPAYMAQDGGLQSGQLAPGGSVTGDVCATDPGAAGGYLIINESFFADPVRWGAEL